MKKYTLHLSGMRPLHEGNLERIKSNLRGTLVTKQSKKWIASHSLANSTSFFILLIYSSCRGLRTGIAKLRKLCSSSSYLHSGAHSLFYPPILKILGIYFVILGLVFLLNKAAYAQNDNTHEAIDSHTINNLTPTAVMQIEELKEQLRSVRGELEKLQFENAKLNEKLTKFAADVELRFSELNQSNAVTNNSIFQNVDQLNAQPDAADIKPTPLEDTKKPEAKQPEKEASKEAKKGVTKEATKETVQSTAKVDKKAKDKIIHDQYQEAYSLLKNHEYKKAQDAFQKFVADHPDSELTGNAYYWLGETYFTKNEFNSAAMNYLKGYQNSSKGSRAADNLLKLSKSLSKLEKTKEACTSLLKLKQDFPSASEAIKKQVAEEISTLKCSSQ